MKIKEAKVERRTMYTRTKYDNYQPKGKSMTQPNQAVNPKLAIKAFNRGDIMQRAINSYPEITEEIPNLHLMDKIERLEKLREFTLKKKALYNKIAHDAIDRMDQIQKEKEIAAKQKSKEQDA